LQTKDTFTFDIHLWDRDMSESGSNSSNVQQGMQKQKQNPFEFSHDKILDDVYRTHFHCLEKCDVASLHTVASNVLNQSMDITHKVIAKVTTFFLKLLSNHIHNLFINPFYVKMESVNSNLMSFTFIHLLDYCLK